VNFVWERLADGVFRCRLPILDVTVGLVYGRTGAMLIDTGTTMTEARAIAEDVQDIANREVSQIVLTHNHFDHILGSSAFDGAEIYCAAEVVTTMAERTEHLRADAVRYGADAAEVDRAIAALRAPEHRVTSAVIDLGGRTVSVSHPGRGGEDAVFVPGHGAVVDAAFVRRQRDWLRTQM
jgi:glyoxylase-like metal-dependent hydrolase (beta-lactamase superfamily II)